MKIRQIILALTMLPAVIGVTSPAVSAWAGAPVNAAASDTARNRVPAGIVSQGVTSDLAQERASAAGLTDGDAVRGSGHALTLDDCLRIALSESPVIKVADMDIVRVDYSKKNVLAELLPQVSFGGQYSRMLAKQVAYMNMKNFGSMGGGSASTPDGDGDDSATTPDQSQTQTAGQRGIKMGLDNSFQLGFSAQMPLVAPQLWASMKLSDAQILQSWEQARASRLDLVAQVKKAYYTLLLAYDSKKVIQESYDMAALTNSIYQKRFSVGDASEYDVLRTSVAMKNVEPQLLQADISIRQARLQLMLLMGVDASADYRFAGELSQYEKTMYEDVMALSTDYSHNTSLVQNALAQNTLDQTVKVNKMAWYPTLALTASYNWTSSSDGSPFSNFRWNPYSVVGLNLSIPLFTAATTTSAWPRFRPCRTFCSATTLSTAYPCRPNLPSTTYSSTSVR